MGLFTSFAQQISTSKENTEVKYQIQQSTFLLPKVPKNCLMVATGSGVAPMLSLLHDKMNNP